MLSNTSNLHSSNAYVALESETFESMLTVLSQAQTQKLPGRPSKLSLEDQLLIALEYGREYRT